MSPTLSDFATRVKPSDYVESLSPLELYELSHEMTKQNYFCELLEGVEEPSEEELKENLQKLTSRLYLLEKNDKRLLNFLLSQYI
jgi:formate dehydrogenase maturation protein FdhE